MAWQDRISEAAYISPSGIRMVFIYEDVSKSFEKKTTAFEFPDADGTFVQDLGHTGRRYPLRVIFSGDDYDLAADAFEELLQERGIARLEHPKYGTVNVVPFGTITRRDDLKTAANQAIFEVVFWETIDLIFPTLQQDPGSNVLSAVDEYNAAAAQAFADSISLATAIERVTVENNYLAVLGTVESALQGIADTQDNVRTQFNAIVDSVNTGIDVLIAQPLALGFQTTLLIQSPARAAADIKARLSAYGNLLDSLTSGNGAAIENNNQFRVNDLYASSYVTGSIVSVVNNQFEIKSDAIGAAEILLDQLTQVTTWRDDTFELLGEIDTGESYQQLQEAVAIAAGFLVEISFSLKQERMIVLDRAHTIVDLVAELYGELDDQFDFFISTNNLSGSEHIELLAGRKIVYYI